MQTVLNDSVNQLSSYLDHHCLHRLLDEKGSRNETYYASLLKSLRRLEVFCNEAHDTVKLIRKSDVFRKEAAQKTLYGIYHKCILEFFSPKADVWYENSRAAYTGESSITYYHEPPQSLQAIVKQLEEGFQQLRDNLACYEGHYQNKMV